MIADDPVNTVALPVHVASPLILAPTLAVTDADPVAVASAETLAEMVVANVPDKDLVDSGNTRY